MSGDTPISVVGAVIQRGDSVLLAQRRLGCAEALKWEFPGGKQTASETPREALERELREELGIDTQIGDLFQVVLHEYGDRTVHLVVFRASILGGEPRPVDCFAVRWVPIRALRDVDFSAADLPVVHRLEAEQGV